MLVVPSTHDKYSCVCSCICVILLRASENDTPPASRAAYVVTRTRVSDDENAAAALRARATRRSPPRRAIRYARQITPLRAIRYAAYRQYDSHSRRLRPPSAKAMLLSALRHAALARQPARAYQRHCHNTRAVLSTYATGARRAAMPTSRRAIRRQENVGVASQRNDADMPRLRSCQRQRRGERASAVYVCCTARCC